MTVKPLNILTLLAIFLIAGVILNLFLRPDPRLPPEMPILNGSITLEGTTAIIKNRSGDTWTEIEIGVLSSNRYYFKKYLTPLPGHQSIRIELTEFDGIGKKYDPKTMKPEMISVEATIQGQGVKGAMGYRS